MVDVEIIELQKVLKLVSLRLETQADTTLHDAIESYTLFRRTNGKHRLKGPGVQVGTGSVLPIFVFIGKLLRDL
jgi:hypothetical protein